MSQEKTGLMLMAGVVVLWFVSRQGCTCGGAK
jgi:hypothetical protein